MCLPYIHGCNCRLICVCFIKLLSFEVFCVILNACAVSARTTLRTYVYVCVYVRVRATNCARTGSAKTNDEEHTVPTLQVVYCGSRNNYPQKTSPRCSLSHSRRTTNSTHWLQRQRKVLATTLTFLFPRLWVCVCCSGCAGQEGKNGAVSLSKCLQTH